MSKTFNNILTITIILCIATLLIYGYCAIQKLDESKEVKVVSTISQHINYKKEVPDDLENNMEPENDGVYEDEDFEEYIEEEEGEILSEEIEMVGGNELPDLEATTDKPLSPFLVIAGSFKDKANAETKVKQLKDLGLSAEIVHLKNSKLHAICIAQTETEQEANDMMTDLTTKHKIKAYVYKTP